jgi:hypothetical protein
MTNGLLPVLGLTRRPAGAGSAGAAAPPAEGAMAAAADLGPALRAELSDLPPALVARAEAALLRAGPERLGEIVASARAVAPEWEPVLRRARQLISHLPPEIVARAEAQLETADPREYRQIITTAHELAAAEAMLGDPAAAELAAAVDYVRLLLPLEQHAAAEQVLRDAAADEVWPLALNMANDVLLGGEALPPAEEPGAADDQGGPALPPLQQPVAQRPWQDLEAEAAWAASLQGRQPAGEPPQAEPFQPEMTIEELAEASPPAMSTVRAGKRRAEAEDDADAEEDGEYLAGRRVVRQSKRRALAAAAEAAPVAPVDRDEQEAAALRAGIEASQQSYRAENRPGGALGEGPSHQGPAPGPAAPPALPTPPPGITPEQMRQATREPIRKADSNFLEALRLIQAGKTDEEIAKKLGVTKKTMRIFRLASELMPREGAFSPVTRRLTEAGAEQIRAYRKSGASAEALSSSFSVLWSTIKATAENEPVETRRHHTEIFQAKVDAYRAQHPSAGLTEVAQALRIDMSLIRTAFAVGDVDPPPAGAVDGVGSALALTPTGIAWVQQVNRRMGIEAIALRLSKTLRIDIHTARDLVRSVPKASS